MSTAPLADRVTLATPKSVSAACRPSAAAVTRYLRLFDANGHIPTDASLPLAAEIGEWVFIAVTVEYVSSVVDGVVYATVTGIDGIGTAIVVLDAQDHAEATGWMTRESVRLAGLAKLLFGQPGLDLRRTPGAPLPSLHRVDRAGSEDRPVPMPGNLPVSVDYGRGLGVASRPLSKAPVGSSVSTTATIASLEVVGLRVRMTLATPDGHTAQVVARSAQVVDASAGLGRRLVCGDVVQLHGTVAEPVGTLPKTIDVYALRAVSA